MSQFYPTQIEIEDALIIDDLITRELGDILEIMAYQLTRLTDASYDPSLDLQRKIAGRILRDRIGATFASVEKLIEKIEFRPILLDRARRVLDVADRPEYIKEVIRELGKARIQDREFDHDLDVLYREARTRLAVLQEGELSVLDQQVEEIAL